MDMSIWTIYAFPYLEENPVLLFEIIVAKNEKNEKKNMDSINRSKCFIQNDNYMVNINTLGIFFVE